MITVAGCSQSMTVQTGFPTPVLEPLPLVVGIRYPDSLTDFVHQEAPPLEAEWTIRLGAANQLLFDKLFGAMFVETVVLDQEADVAAHPELDAVIEPTLEEFEFSLPRQSQTDQYAVWLRYNVRVYTPDGELISNWPVTAYGQVGAKKLGAEKSMQQATVLAMRDAAANIAVGFINAPGIKDKLLPQTSDDNDEQT
jgi:hypothetical protein